MRIWLLTIFTFAVLRVAAVALLGIAGVILWGVLAAVFLAYVQWKRDALRRA